MEKDRLQVMRVMSRSLQFFHELTGDVGPPIQFTLKHLKLAVVDVGGSPLLAQHLRYGAVEQKRPVWKVNQGGVLRIG